jgi:hypothetical protein
MVSVRNVQLGVTLDKLDVGKCFMCDMNWQAYCRQRCAAALTREHM